MALTAPPTFERSQHLVALVAEIERLATTVADAAVDEARQPVVADLHDAATVATLQLDGSTITAPPTADEIARLRAAAPEPSERDETRGTWLDALGSYLDLDEAADGQIWTLEFLAAREALEADELAERLATDFVAALHDLHRRATTGLVAPAAAAVLRRSDLAVQDGSVGRILFYPTAPNTIERDLHLLGSWVEGPGSREHGLVLSGVVHYELLRIHPYLSANGRLARTAARLLLRSRGLDPHRLAVAEVALNEAPLVGYEQVAKSLRRRDLTIWLETWGEAVAAGLRTAAWTVATDRRREVDEHARRFADERVGTDFTVAEYRATVGVGPDDCRAQLDQLLDAGLITRVLGGRGLRFRVPARDHGAV